VTVNVREIIEQHHGFYEVAPYYVVVEDRTQGHPTSRRVQAGFDVDIYGFMVNPEIKASDDYEQI
jgi:hypothetical protein